MTLFPPSVHARVVFIPVDQKGLGITTLRGKGHDDTTIGTNTFRGLGIFRDRTCEMWRLADDQHVHYFNLGINEAINALKKQRFVTEAKAKTANRQKLRRLS